MSDVLDRLKKGVYDGREHRITCLEPGDVDDAIAEIERLTRERDEAREKEEAAVAVSVALQRALSDAEKERDEAVKRAIQMDCAEPGVKAMYAAAEKYNAHTPGADWSVNLPMRMVDEILSLRTERDEARARATSTSRSLAQHMERAGAVIADNASLRASLVWYQHECEALEKHLNAKTDAAEACITVLALDAGKRARRALEKNPEREATRG